MNAFFNNFIYGMQASARNTSITLSVMAHNQLVQGVLIGLLISTCLHLFIISERPRHLPSMLFLDTETCIKKVFAQGPTCVDPEVLKHFTKTVEKTKLTANIFIMELSFFLFFSLLFF